MSHPGEAMENRPIRREHSGGGYARERHEMWCLDRHLVCRGGGTPTRPIRQGQPVPPASQSRLPQFVPLSNSLARAVFHGQRGQLRRHYQVGQENQLDSLGIMINVIVLWQTV